MLTEHAPAKLNLALHVRRRRTDGYHDIDTLFAFATDGDVVHAEVANNTGLRVVGPFGASLSPDADNLVLRAAAAFESAFGVQAGLAFTLEKRLPVASGIGGGSADAAATLRLLARHHAIALDDTRLLACAEGLGADVPVCLARRPAIGSGKGETLVPAELGALAGAPMLLVNPGVALSTPAVFAEWDGVDRGPLPEGDALAIAMGGRNDLTDPAIRQAPAIANILHALGRCDGMRLARMSGSGATCFALFDDVSTRDAAADVMVYMFPKVWTLRTELAA